MEDPAEDVFVPPPDVFSNPTNLVPNPGFEFAEADDTPSFWVPVFKSHPQYAGDLAPTLDAVVDRNTFRSGTASLRLSNSRHAPPGAESTAYSAVDYTKSFTFEGYVTCERATGTTFLEIAWYRFWMPMGYGWKGSAVFAWSSSIPGHQDGSVIRGALSKGIPLGRGDRRLNPSSAATRPHRSIAHPKGYPFLTVAADYPVAGSAGNQELHEVPVGVCLPALHDLERAREHLQPRKAPPNTARMPLR